MQRGSDQGQKAGALRDRGEAGDRGEVAGLRRRKSGIESHRLLFLVPLGPISTNDGTEIAPNIGNGRAVIEAQGAVKFSALTHPQVQESEAVRRPLPFFSSRAAEHIPTT
jgi:hypothetical protein